MLTIWKYHLNLTRGKLWNTLKPLKQILKVSILHQNRMLTKILPSCFYWKYQLSSIDFLSKWFRISLKFVKKFPVQVINCCTFNCSTVHFSQQNFKLSFFRQKPSRGSDNMRKIFKTFKWHLLFRLLLIHRYARHFLIFSLKFSY